MKQLQWLSLLVGSLLVLSVQPSWAEVAIDSETDKADGLNSSITSVTPSVAKIPRLQNLSRPATTVKDWMAQVEAATVQVTSVRVDRTDTGLEIVLQTAANKPLQVDATKFRSEGNSLIADIPNAVLTLSDTQAFNIDRPTGDIANVRVVQQEASSIRISVTGTNALPSTDVTLKTGELAYSLNPEADEPDEEIVVTGERQRGYRVPNSTTATKTDTPLRDIPQSIQIVPQQVLQDQQVTNFREALKNVPGVSQGPISGSRGAFDLPVIRGFNASNSILRNGLRDITNQYLGFEQAGLERIEVLKGPASVLYGQTSFGGVINYVTKQPLREAFYSLEASAGSFNFYRGAVDLSGPLNNSRTVLYRLNAAAQATGSFLDFYDEQRYFVSPVFSWQISDRTKLTLRTEYLTRQKDFTNFGLPAVGTVLPNPNGRIRRDFNSAGPNTADNSRAIRVGYDLEHRFSENWQIRNAFGASFINRDRTQGIFFHTSLAPNNRTLNRNYQEDNDTQTFFNLDTYVVGKFATGSIQHQLVAGFDLTRNISDNTNIQRNAAPIDLFNPVYNETLGAVNRRIDQLQFNDALGIYVQDQVTLADNLKLLLGLRFDATKQDTENRITNTEQEQSSSAFSPRVGIVYQPIPPISLYASYSRAFNPVVGTAFSGEQFQPERGTQYEAGIKADLSNRLSATLAFFDLTRSNVLTADPANPLFSIQTGEQRSKGFEFNLAGEILPGWNIIAGYAYTDTEITRDNTFAVGNAINLIPKNSFNIWTSYEFQRGPFQGFGVGVGVFFVGDRQGDLANTYELPNYLRTDAAIFYRRNRFRAALNFRNLFDINYFETANGRLNVFYGDPLTVQGTISWQF